MKDINVIVNGLYNWAMFFLQTILFLALMISAMYLLLKFIGRAPIKSIQLENSLKTAKSYDKDPLAFHTNRCVGRSTVEYSADKNMVLLHIPTKRILEIGSKMETQKILREKLESDNFRYVLSDIFPDYNFESHPRFYKNELLLKGTRF